MSVFESDEGKLKPSAGKSSGVSKTSSFLREFHFIEDSDVYFPIIYVEMGDFETRLGVWNPDSERFELRFSCPTIIAVPRNDKRRLSIVRGASSQSDQMYQTFRDTGMFVGSDAKYCCYEHPDAGLRGALEVSPIIKNGHIVSKAGLLALLQHIIFRALAVEDTSKVQLLLSYKLCASEEDLKVIAECLFDKLRLGVVCLISEASLIASSLNNCVPVAQVRPKMRRASKPPTPTDSSPSSPDVVVDNEDNQSPANTSSSAVIVDIGSVSTTVYPTFDGLIMRNAVRSCAVGGEHCTDFMELLLSAQHSELFSSLLPRRQKLIARQVKEQYAFIAESFDDAVEEYGSFRFDTVKMIGLQLESIGSIDTVNSAGSDRSRMGNSWCEAAAASSGGRWAGGVIGGGGEGTEGEEEEEDCIPAPDGNDAASLLSLGATTSQRNSDIGLRGLGLDVDSSSNPRGGGGGGDGDDGNNPNGAGEEFGGDNETGSPRGSLSESPANYFLRYDQDKDKGNKRRSRISYDPKTTDKELLGPREVMAAVSISPANQEILNAIRKDFVTKLPSGDVLSLVVDKERFHCCEVLFKPDLFEGCGANQTNSAGAPQGGGGRSGGGGGAASTDNNDNNNNDNHNSSDRQSLTTMSSSTLANGRLSKGGGIVDTILEAVEAVDLSVRDEVCTVIVLTGRTALVPGLVKRLTTDLHNGLSGLGIHTYTVVVAEDEHGATAESFGMVPVMASSPERKGYKNSPESLTKSKSGRRLVPVSPVSRLSSAPLWDESGSPNRAPDSRLLNPICCSRGSGAPSVAWAGASLKVQRSKSVGGPSIEPQNFVTIEDYQEHGVTVLQKLLIY